MYKQTTPCAMKRNVVHVIDRLVLAIQDQERLAYDTSISEERRMYARGMSSGYVQCYHLLQFYMLGICTLQEVRTYLRQRSKRVDTTYGRGVKDVFKEVLQELAPVPRQKRCAYCEDVLEPETARKNLCSDMYQPLCITCYEGLEEISQKRSGAYEHMH